MSITKDITITGDMVVGETATTANLSAELRSEGTGKALFSIKSGAIVDFSSLSINVVDAAASSISAIIDVQDGGITAKSFRVETSDNDMFASALVMEDRNGKVYAEIGIISKKLLKKFDINNPVYYADIHWSTVVKAIRKKSVSFHDISKYPAVSRDLALLIDKGVKFADIERIARQTEKKYLKSVELFDVYEGKNLPEGKKSYAVNFILQDEEKTLNDKQIDTMMNKLITNLKKELKAELR